MLKKLKTLNRRGVCGVGAGIVALSLVIGGAFAWVDNSQHKSNIATGGSQTARNDIVLVEDFESPPDWQHDEELTKEISVRNIGDGQVFVRIQLKEYMDIAEVKYVYSDEKLLTDESGKFVAGETKKDLSDWLDGKEVSYTDSQIKEYTAYGDTTSKFYLATNETTNINGRDGKFMLLSYSESAAKSLVDGVSRAAYEETDNHQSHPTGECAYTPHKWYGESLAGGRDKDPTKDPDPNADPFHEYVKWNLGEPVENPTNLIKLSEWDGIPVAAWILDDISEAKDQGWAYWGESLKSGESTTMLLNSIKLIKQPSGPFYYALHVDMQAVDIHQLKAEFKGIPQKLEDSYRGKIGFAISADVQAANQGSFVRFKAYWNGADITDQIDWTSIIPKKGSAASIGGQTRFRPDTAGQLKIGPAQPLGTIVVTAKYTADDGNEYTQKFVLTVKQPVTPPTTTP